MTESTLPAASLLLVDDEPSILAALRRLLRPHGFTIYTAEGGKAGLEVLEQHPIDLVISDMRMPEMDGAKFLELVRERRPETMRLLLTGYSDVSSTIDAINRGEIFRYIAKPWNDDDLLLVVKDALEKQRLVSENARLLALTTAQNDELKDLNANLEDKVRQRTSEIEQVNSFLNLANDQLKQNFLISVKMFSGLIELRGGAMAGHSRRVGDLAKKLAEHMNVPSGEAQDIFYAALLHDIGKIGFPDALFKQPVSRMNSEELKQYRTHITAGEAALMPLDELKQAATIIRAHHERFDGQGFPDRLEGKAIPLGARILSVVNDYDGLQIGTLAEKQATPAEAKEMIRQARGKRYDPDIVDAFLIMIERTETESIPEQRVPCDDLRPGMVLARDLVGREGALLLSVDYVLNPALIRQIQAYSRRQEQPPSIYIKTPFPPEEKPQ